MTTKFNHIAEGITFKRREQTYVKCKTCGKRIKQKTARTAFCSRECRFEQQRKIVKARYKELTKDNPLCKLCNRPVSNEALALYEGEIYHDACKRKLTNYLFRANQKPAFEKGGRVERPKLETFNWRGMELERGCFGYVMAGADTW